jgi:type II secretory ATPase GspE/PulE/Tfp pilus assembly ATPase PilB-like protein
MIPRPNLTEILILRFPYKNDLFVRPKGCSKCGNSGYRGRTGAPRNPCGDNPLKSLIQGRAKMEEIRAQAIQDGMTTLMQDGIRKVLLGLTDLLQVRKVCIK